MKHRTQDEMEKPKTLLLECRKRTSLKYKNSVLLVQHLNKFRTFFDRTNLITFYKPDYNFCFHKFTLFRVEK